MVHRAPYYGAPPRFSHLMYIVDPTDDPNEVVIGDDLLKANDWELQELKQISIWLNGFLADPSITTADIKGLLNRTAGRAWDTPFEISGRTFLEALSRHLRIRIG